jgi:ribosome biogenesis protein BRX1
VYTQAPRRGQLVFLDMAPVLKVHEQGTAIMEKRKGKRKVDDLNEDGEGDVPYKSLNKKKRNKQRVLLLSSRGITHRMRHLMNDLETLLPHVKKGVCEIPMPSHSWHVGLC